MVTQAEVAGYATTGLDTLMYVMLGLVVLGVILFFFYLSRFKHTIILKDLANNRKIVTKTKFREYIDREGILFIQTLKKIAGRRLHPIPPPHCVELQNNGKKWVEAYVTDTGEIHYITDNGLKDGIPTLEAFTTKQRSILINQYKKAAERRGKKWQDLLIPIIGIAALVIIVVALLVFYKDMGEPLLAMADKVNSFEKEKTTQMEIMERIERNIQLIANDVGAEQSRDPPN